MTNKIARRLPVHVLYAAWRRARCPTHDGGRRARVNGVGGVDCVGAPCQSGVGSVIGYCSGTGQWTAMPGGRTGYPAIWGVCGAECTGAPAGAGQHLPGPDRTMSGRVREVRCQMSFRVTPAQRDVGSVTESQCDPGIQSHRQSHIVTVSRCNGSHC